MLISGEKLKNLPILSVQASSSIGFASSPIVDPDSLKILGFSVVGPLLKKSPANILDSKSIREYSSLGFVIDSIDELVEKDDVLKIKKVLELKFDLIGLKVETKKGTNLGHIEDFTLTPDDFMIQQLIVKRPLLKSFVDPELIIPRQEIVEITDYKVIVKDEEKEIKARAEKENFIPNFVNPFRTTKQAPAPAQTKSPAELDTK